MRIITNNPDVKERFPDICEYISGNVRDVFKKVRDEIHKGARLVSHPISGSLKPGQIPYKSVAILPAKSGDIDLRSLAYIEDSIEIYRLTARKRLAQKDVHIDYKVIDLDLITSVLTSNMGVDLYSKR